MIVVDGEGKIRIANSMVEKLFGYGRQDLYGRTIEILIPAGWRGRHPEQRKDFSRQPAVRPMASGLEPYGRRRDGTEFPVDISLSPLTTEEGLMITAAIRDATDRKRTEQLQAAQYAVAGVLAGAATVAEAAPKLLQVLGESLGWEMGELWRVDPDAMLLRYTDSWHVPAIAVSEFVTVSGGITLPPGTGLPGRAWQCGEPVWLADVARAAGFQRAALAERAGLHGALAFPILLGSQTLGVMVFFSRQMRQPEERLLKMLSTIGSQIGQFMERKRTEEALRFSEARYRALHRDNPTMIFTLDTTGTVLSVNPSGASQLGYAIDELEGQPVLSVFHPDDRPAVAAQLRRCLENPRLVHRWLFRKIRKNGVVMWVEELAQAVYDLKGELNVLVVCQDITERKKAQEVLERRVAERTQELSEANARLQDLDRLKSMFIASMSHELRTPLNSIIGFSSILLDEWVGPLTDEQKENLAAILRSGKHLLALINDVIDVSKVEAGRIEPQIEEFEVSEVLAEAMAAFGREIEAKGLDLQVESVRQLVRADRQRLLQCILNLISNAVKFTEAGSIAVQSTLCQCPVTIDEEAATRLVGRKGKRGSSPLRGKCIELSVTDTGIGILAEDLSRLFSPFVRLESPLSSKVAGTGLGLYLTRKLVTEVLRGEVAVTSRYGEGSTFSVRMPIG
jgi:PAS domain S-box-containing protein